MTHEKDPERIEVRRLHDYVVFAGKRVLEVGCGDGRLTWRYANAARHVTGIDLDGDELRIARIERASNLENTVALAQADSVRLPFRSEAFDLAIFAWSF